MADQPISATVLTERPVISLQSLRGSDSSSRMRIRGQCLVRQFQRFYRLLPGHGRKVVEKLVKRITRFKIVEEVFNRNAGTRKYGHATLNSRITMYRLAHSGNLLEPCSLMIQE